MSGRGVGWNRAEGGDWLTDAARDREPLAAAGTALPPGEPTAAASRSKERARSEAALPSAPVPRASVPGGAGMGVGGVAAAAATLPLAGGMAAASGWLGGERAGAGDGAWGSLKMLIRLVRR